MTSSRVYTLGVMNRFLVDERNSWQFPDVLERHGRRLALELGLDPTDAGPRVLYFAGQAAVSAEAVGEQLPPSVLRWAIEDRAGVVDLTISGDGLGEALAWAAPDAAAVERGITIFLPIQRAIATGAPLPAIPVADALDLGELYVELVTGSAGALNPTALSVAAPGAFPAAASLRARREAIDRLPGDVHPPAQYPLTPELEAIRQAAIDGLRQAGIPVTMAVDTSVWVDGTGATRVDLSVPLAPNNTVLPPISGRTLGDPAASSVVKVDVTVPTDGDVPSTHVRVIDVSDSRIRYANTEPGGGFTTGDVVGAVTAATARAAGPLLSDGKLRQPWIGDRSATIGDDGTVRTTPRPPPGGAKGRLVAGAVAGALLVAVGLGVALAGGGDGDGDDGVEVGDEIATDGGPAPTDAPGDDLAAGTTSTDPADLAAAVPGGDMAWVAHLTQVVAPPPLPIQPLAVGHEFRGTLALVESCATDPCTYTTVFDLGVAPHPVGEVPAIAWVQDGANWRLDSYAHALSASYGAGLDCVYLRRQVWDFTTTDAVWDGERWLVGVWDGTLRIDTQLDAELSAGAIAKKLCPAYQDVSDWEAMAGRAR